MRSSFNEWKRYEVRPSVAAVSVLSLAIILTLTAPFEAEAAGFNVNSNVTFTPIPSTYRATTDAAGCPGFAGKFSFTSLLTNKADSPAMPGITVQVQTLTNGNVLFDPQANKPIGGEGAVMQVPKTGQYADGLLSPGESVDVPFVLCLKTFQPFQFFVNVSGIVTELVKLGPLPLQGISPDGRIVAFGSSYIQNVVTGQTYTVAYQGTYQPVVVFSGDSRFVAYWVLDIGGPGPGGCFPTSDVFRLDLTTNTNELVSAGRTGQGHVTHCSPGSPTFIDSSMSANGQFVAFVSSARGDLGPIDTSCPGPCAWVRDMQAKMTMLVSINRDGKPSGSGSSPWISADGRFVAFLSDSTDLTPTDTTHHQNVFVRDLVAGTTTLVSDNWMGTAVGGNGDASNVYITPDGRFVLFVSSASDLVKNDTNGQPDVFVYDRQTKTMTLVSMNQQGDDSGNGSSGSPSITPDGRFVAFESDATNLTATSDANGRTDVFRRDLQMGATALVSVNRSGDGSGNSISHGHGLSPDGRFVVFNSDASNLVPTDTNGATDVFVRDMQTGSTALVSINLAGADSGDHFSAAGLLSGNGQFVAFTSGAKDLVLPPPPASSPGGVYIRPIQ